MKDEYIIVNKTAIQKRIEELEGMKNNPDKLKDPRDWSYVCGQLDILNSFLSQSTSLIPVLESAFNEGIDCGIMHYIPEYKDEEGDICNVDIKGLELSRQEYLLNLKLDI